MGPRKQKKREDGLAAYNPDPAESHGRLSKLCKDMYDMSRSLDEHYLEACTDSAEFGASPVSAAEFEALRDELAAFSAIVDANSADYAACSTTIYEAFSRKSNMKLWNRVIRYLANDIHKKSQYYNNNPPWNTWIEKLYTMTTTLPELLVRVVNAPTQIYTDEEWQVVVEKVAFIDWTVDYAFTNDWIGIPRRPFHLGTETNRRLSEGRDGNSPGRSPVRFKENTPNNPAFWSRPDKASESSFLSRTTQSRMEAGVFIITICAACVGFRGWYYSGEENTKAGEVTDPDQWFLIQGALMSVLAIFVLWMTTPAPLSWGIKVWMLVSVVFSIAGPASYTFFPAEFGATFAWVGIAVQNLVILQSMFAAGDGKLKQD